MPAAHSPPNALPCPPEGITTTVRVAETGLDDVREARRRKRVEPSFHEKDRDVTGRLGQRPPGDRSDIPRVAHGVGPAQEKRAVFSGIGEDGESAELIVAPLSADSEVPFSPVAWSPGTVSCAASSVDDPGVTRSDRLRRRREDGRGRGVLRSEAPRHHLLTAHDEQRAVRVAHRRCVRYVSIWAIAAFWVAIGSGELWAHPGWAVHAAARRAEASFARSTSEAGPSGTEVIEL